MIAPSRPGIRTWTSLCTTGDAVEIGNRHASSAYYEGHVVLEYSMMSHSGNNVMRRDGWLMLAIILFLISGVAWFAQAWILNLYIWSVGGRDWSLFLRYFSSYATETPPEQFYQCLGKCYPDLPFLPGWIGICSFLLGLTVLVRSWWKSKSSN